LKHNYKGEHMADTLSPEQEAEMRQRLQERQRLEQQQEATRQSPAVRPAQVPTVPPVEPRVEEEKPVELITDKQIDEVQAHMNTLNRMYDDLRREFQKQQMHGRAQEVVIERLQTRNTELEHTVQTMRETIDAQKV
jgi:hypothetical protein